jgi:hypothetical protein
MTATLTAYGTRMTPSQKDALETIKILRDRSVADMTARLVELRKLDPDTYTADSRPSQFITRHAAMQAGVSSNAIDFLIRKGLLEAFQPTDSPAEIRPTV